ncbi:MAG: hypothetical protein ACRCWY_11025, partial [Cellulosilyticaceae bacterium]
MRRKIAGLLAIVLLVSIFQGLGVPTFAVEVGEFVELNQTIVKEDGIYKLGDDKSLRSDEVVVEIPMTKEGKFKKGTYVLDYYLPQQGQTTTEAAIGVRVTMDSTKTNTEAPDQSGGSIEVTLQKVIGGNPSTVPSDTFKKTITRKNIGSKDANGLTVDEFGGISLFIKEDKLYFSASGIKQGFVIPFSLSYREGGTGTAKNYVSYIFKGLSQMQVTPTHLLTDGEKKDI